MSTSIYLNLKIPSGDIRSQRQDVSSTQPATQPQDDKDDGRMALAKPKQQDFIIKIYNVQRTLYTNQTGNFPRTSSRGNKYQMFLHKIDSNSTWVEPMSIKTEQSMIAARACGLERMRGAGLDPKHQILNNEASEKYKAAITNSGMTYQLVPTDDQRRNIAEKEIHFWKDHLAAVLSGTSATSPIHLLYQVIPQAERQILLLHQSNTNPKISSYAHIYGAHNYSMHPFFPIDMETLVHDKPLRRKTWAEHATANLELLIKTAPDWQISM